MEDGEIGQVDERDDQEHNPSLEWPGGALTVVLDDTQPRGTRLGKSKPWVILRLLVTRTSILSRKHRVAIINGYNELQFGRDIGPVGTNIPRIRLKEMLVSKLHATAFWDAYRREWGVVDMGSKHGTFIRPAISSGDHSSTDTRLSPPRTASIPRRLRHLDHLIIGSTSFLIHIHEDGFPCIECSSDGGDEIPLFPPSQSGEDLKRSRDVAEIDGDAIEQRDPKKALSMLKQSLLMRHERIRPSMGSTYVDRSARRRALHPGSRTDTPGISADVPTQPTDAAPTEVSQPPTPLPASNVGHRLLMKQGWQPGTPLGGSSGEEGAGLVEPLVVSPSVSRQGVGMTSKLADTPSGWKESGRQKRWDGITLD
jgi:hypothetical protein